MAVLRSKRAKDDPWRAKLLATKPRKVAAVALANEMARIGWALMIRQEDFRRLPAAAKVGSVRRLARVATRDGNVGQLDQRGKPVVR
jgi:hypothetical protein